MENTNIKKTKGNVPVRCKASAGVRLDEYLTENPNVTEVAVVTDALNWYFDMKAGLSTIELPKIEKPSAVTPG